MLLLVIILPILLFIIPSFAEDPGLDHKPAYNRIIEPKIQEICIQQTWIPGDCVIQLLWGRITTDERDTRWEKKSKVTESIDSLVFDGHGNQLEVNPPGFRTCTGQAGEECVIDANLGMPILLSPQIQNDYMQFYFGDQAWHTDPHPKDSSVRVFVGEDKQNLRPYCVDEGWTEWPKKEGSDEYDPPFDREKNRYLDVRAKNLTCWFDCHDIRAKWGDPNVKLCHTSKGSMKTKSITTTHTLACNTSTLEPTETYTQIFSGIMMSSRESSSQISTMATTLEPMATTTVLNHTQNQTIPIATRTGQIVTTAISTATMSEIQTQTTPIHTSQVPTTIVPTETISITALVTEIIQTPITQALPLDTITIAQTITEFPVQTVIKTEYPTSTVTETETTTLTLVLTKTVTDIPIGYTLVPFESWYSRCTGEGYTRSID
ncbi:hypothetical protein TWF788_003347 [Orbilia oligospora]|uniref:Uncharacterized protein n=1 Tax=Orbilia oligospora TaxID=2813651 RepID=A0A7C8TYN0_ORBOL|nr:hypothetical protein TWF788_003347 [Orbilia oligospora]